MSQQPFSLIFLFSIHCLHGGNFSYHQDLVTLSNRHHVTTDASLTVCTVQFQDPLGSYIHTQCTTKAPISLITSRLKSTLTKWKLIEQPHALPLQRNGYDCGAFICVVCCAHACKRHAYTAVLCCVSILADVSMPKWYDSQQYTSMQYAVFKTYKCTNYAFKQINSIIKIVQCVPLHLSHLLVENYEPCLMITLMSFVKVFWSVHHSLPS